MKEVLRQEIENIIQKSPITSDLEHARRTLKWLLVLEPEADEEFQIAALGHDVERGITGITNKDLKDMSNYDKDRQEHSQRSAAYLKELMKKYLYSEESIKRTEKLILEHEVGGDRESDLLRDADSIAYFDYNIPLYLKRNGEEKTRYKIKYMFGRVSNNAKKIIFGLRYDDKYIEDLVKESLGK